MSFSNENTDQPSSDRRDDREMFDITCSKCGTAAQVPFKPDEDRPVYCQDCYREMRPPRRSRY